ncbi:hypothetical protein ACFL0Q_07655 [Thermodesulfobacteriota bacterium]
MNEPRITTCVDCEDFVWIGVHKDSALMEYFAKGALETTDIGFFREVVALQHKLCSMQKEVDKRRVDLVGK